MKIFFPLIGVFALAHTLVAQSPAYHTFTPPPSGSDIIWPASILDGEDLYPGNEISPGLYYDGWIAIENDINNTLFFDSNGLTLANAPNISGDALWGNPRSGIPLSDPDLYFTFDYFFSEDENGDLIDQVTSISFDFAWASPDPSADLGTVIFEVQDYQGNIEFVEVQLDQNFAHGAGGTGEGYSAHVVITAGETVGLENIRSLDFSNLEVINSGPFNGAAFAMDNISINASGTEISEVGPVDYEGNPSSPAYGTNALKGTGNFGFTENIYNGGSDPTTFSVNWTGNSPLIYQPVPYQNVPISPGETIYGAVEWEVDTNAAPSGVYSGEFTIVNEGNPGDPDDRIEVLYFNLFDPPALGGNAGATLTVPGAPATLTNAAVAGHPGALRASVWITDVIRTNTRFTVNGMAKANVVNYVVQNPAVSEVGPGGSLTGNISFNPVGAAAGTHVGSLRLTLAMTTPAGYLNSRLPVPDRVWTLSYTVPPKPTAAPPVITGQPLDEARVDISGEDTGAAIVGGTSSSDQTVSLGFNASPPVANPSGYGSAIDLDFGSTEELYVLQLSYSDLPDGYSEADLRIQALDAATWVPALSLNGNGGTPVAGAAPYAGSYAAYLAELGGNTLDGADLGAFGIDAGSNTAWIVLDYEGTFQLATGAFTAPPKILGFTYDAASNTSTLTYQSVLGVTFDVTGGSSLDALAPIGTTAVGTGGIMSYQHQPATAPSRYFYRLGTP